MGPDFDIVVVGAGSAGVALAARLSEDPARSVLLVEAGPDYPTFRELPDELRVGRASGTLAPTPGIHDWGFVGRMSAAGVEVHVPRGKATGGSSAVNGQIFVRGVPEDYDGWREAGNDGWGWSDVLPFFCVSEADSDYRDSLHGHDGPIPVHRYPEETWTQPTRGFFAACRAAGFPYCADVSTGLSGVGPKPMNNPGGIRVSTALGYLPDARERDNFTLRAGCSARRVLLEGTCAVGVELEDADGSVLSVSAGEVVLSAGAIGSPQLLMLSGVGPREQLEAVGIPVEHELRGVGQHLKDHPMARLSWGLTDEAALGVDDPHGQVTLRYTAAGSDVRNDLWVSGLGVANRFVLVAGVHAPCSVGELRLVSADPHVQPFLDYGLLSDERDVRRLLEAVRLSLALVERDELRPILVAQLDPTPDQTADDATLEAWVRQTVTTTHHVCCTCRMGVAGDPGAVVGADGRVHGVQGLRVVDASIFPEIPRAPTNATTIMVAERIASLMRHPRGLGGSSSRGALRIAGDRCAARAGG